MRAVSHRVGVCLAIATVTAACGLDVQGTGPSTSEEADGASSSSDGAARDGATTSRADASYDSAAPPPDARLDTGADARPTDCDVDKDGHVAKACGGDDCCDDDPRARPGSTTFYDTADACGSFDYDCNGKDEREYGVAATCDQAFVCADPGFQNDTACGANAPFSTCDWLFGCHPSPTTRTQRCR